MYKLIPFEVKEKLFTPRVTTLQEQKDGSFFVGFLFADKTFLNFRLKDRTIVQIKDMKLEEQLGDDVLGITGGLRGTTTGDTAFATLHKGSGGLMGMFKKTTPPKNDTELWEDLAYGNGAFGFSYKHSIVQIVEGRFKIRSSKMSGALLDVSHIGDFIFGLAGNCIFREPYLNSEKRYFLREDLQANYRFHKVEDGVFWLAGDQNKLMKLNLQDVKALPTTKKVPAVPMKASVDCSADGWLYAVAGSFLFRIRVNPENLLNDLQIVKNFEGAAALSVTATELEVEEGEPRKAKLWVSVATEKSTDLYSFESTRPVDMEEIPPAPELHREWSSNDIVYLDNLLYSQEHGLVGTCYNGNGQCQLFIE